MFHDLVMSGGARSPRSEGLTFAVNTIASSLAVSYMAHNLLRNGASR
jgi:hypothetical protein